MAPAEGPVGVWERRFEIETIPRLQDKSFGLRPEFQLSLEEIDELLAFVAEIGKLGEGLSLELHQKRFHVLPRLLIGEGLIIVAACLPSEMPGIDHLAFIASDQDHFLLRVTVLKEEADADVEGLGDLEKGSDPGDTVYAQPNPDYFQYVDVGGTGLKPVGYGYRSIEYIFKRILECMEIIGGMNEKNALSARQKFLDVLDNEGIMATPRNSAYNELVMEAGRMSILNEGREVEISYGKKAGVSFKKYRK